MINVILKYNKKSEISLRKSNYRKCVDASACICYVDCFKGFYIIRVCEKLFPLQTESCK